jgi:hypothetical protein
MPHLQTVVRRHQCRLTRDHKIQRHDRHSKQGPVCNFARNRYFLAHDNLRLTQFCLWSYVKWTKLKAKYDYQDTANEKTLSPRINVNKKWRIKGAEVGTNFGGRALFQSSAVTMSAAV